jgi:hypothetical protein
MDRVTRVAEHERLRLHPPTLGARRRHAPEEESLEDRGRRLGVAADPFEAGVRQVGQPARGDPSQAADHARDRGAERQADEQRRERECTPQQRVVEHRHLDHHAA